MKLKGVELGRFLLAPMEEVNDIAFRMLCKGAGADLTYTGMVHPLSEEKIIFDDNPGVQIFCSDSKGVREFIGANDEAKLFDLNLCCPSKVARKMGFGAYLQPYPSKVEDILRSMSEATEKPLGVKLRKSKYVDQLLEIVENYLSFRLRHHSLE